MSDQVSNDRVLAGCQSPNREGGMYFLYICAAINEANGRGHFLRNILASVIDDEMQSGEMLGIVCKEDTEIDARTAFNINLAIGFAREKKNVDVNIVVPNGCPALKRIRAVAPNYSIYEAINDLRAAYQHLAPTAV